MTINDIDKKWIIGGAVAAIILIILIITFSGGDKPKEEVEITPITTQPEPEAETADTEDEEEGITISETLPSLNDSDDAFRQIIRKYLGAELVAFLVNSTFIQKLVIQVDNVAEGKIAYRHSPVKPPAQSFMVERLNDGSLYISPASYKRYDPYISALEKVDMKLLVAVYRFFLPLFEEAYSQLGHPAEGFQPRLRQAIQHIQKGPAFRGKVRVVHPTVVYHYSDKRLEKLSQVYKQLIRLGPNNISRLKQVLSRFEEQLDQ